MEATLKRRRMAARFIVIDLPLYLLWRQSRRERRGADERRGPVRVPDSESAVVQDSGVRGAVAFELPRDFQQFPFCSLVPFPAFGQVPHKGALLSSAAATP